MQSKDTLKKKAKLLVAELAQLKGPAQYQDALELLAKLEGYRNWKTMSASLDRPGPPKSNEDSAVPHSTWPVVHVGGESYRQREIPGSGLLFRVPVCVDTSMSAVVLVRAADGATAIEQARKLVADGKAPLEVDDGNYRRLADHYCPDSGPDGVYPLVEPPQGFDDSIEVGTQRGPLLVRVMDLGEDDDTLLWAELSVFNPNEGEAAEAFGALSCLPVEATEAQREAFCAQVAQALVEGADNVLAVSANALYGAFVHLVQAGLTEQTKVEAARILRDN